MGAAFKQGYVATARLPDADSVAGRFLIFACVMANHLLADYITSRFGTRGVTSVRVAKSKSTGKVKYSMVKKLYSFYQFLAVGSHLLPHRRTMDLGYNSLIAIQSSAFLMTLCRKNIVTFRTHGLVYSICLVISAGYILRCFLPSHGPAFVLGVFVVFQMRVMLRANKYALWVAFAALATPEISGVVSAHATAIVGAAVGMYGGSFSWVLAPATALACYGALAHYTNIDRAHSRAEWPALVATAKNVTRLMRGGRDRPGSFGANGGNGNGSAIPNIRLSA